MPDGERATIPHRHRSGAEKTCPHLSQRLSPTKTTPKIELSSLSPGARIINSPQGMGRAHGQRPWRPWGAVERVALVGGGQLSRQAATRTPPWGSHPWTTEDGGACGAGENNRRA